MQRDSLAIGIVVFNTVYSVIHRAIETIVQNDYPAQIKVLCNNPDDSYYVGLRDALKIFPVEFIRSHRNEGFGAGHNEILKVTNSDWYLCCNPDVKLDSHCLKNMVDQSKKLKDGILFVPKILSNDGTLQPVFRPHINLKNWIERQLYRLSPRIFKSKKINFNSEILQEVEFVSGCFFLVKVESLRRLQGFDERFFLYCEDADLSYRASKIGKNYYIPSAFIYHDWQKAWTKSFKHFVYYMKSFIKYNIKHLG